MNRFNFTGENILNIISDFLESCSEDEKIDFIFHLNNILK